MDSDGNYVWVIGRVKSDTSSSSKEFHHIRVKKDSDDLDKPHYIDSTNNDPIILLHSDIQSNYIWSCGQSTSLKAVYSVLRL